MSAAWRSRSGGPGQVSVASHQHAPPPPPSTQPHSHSATPAGPFPPGYPNAPPVTLPPSINQQQWNQGYWRFDPKPGWTSASAQAAPGAIVPVAYNHNRPDSQAGGRQSQPPPAQGAPAWMPHPGWQFPADFNPYKRVPKPPDPSYWATELSDNPLGLENMHITKEFIAEHDGHTMQTPWVWQPASLEDDDQSDEPRDPRGKPQRVSSASQQVARRESSTKPANSQDSDPYRSRSYSSSQAQPPSSRQPSTQSSSTPQRTSGLSRSSTHDSYHTPPHSSSSREDRPSDRSKRETREPPPRMNPGERDANPEAFSSEGRELHPTFSTAIVRTPKYYSERTNTPVGTPTRPSSNAPVRRASEPVHSSSQSRSSAQPPLVSHLTSNKSDMLSPLIGATPRPSSTAIPGERSSRDLPAASSSEPSRPLSHLQPISKRSESPYSQPPSHSSSSSASQSRTLGRSQTYPTLDPVSEDPFSSTPRDIQSSRNPPLSSSRKAELKDASNRHSRSLSRSQTYPEKSIPTDPRRPISPSRAKSPVSHALSPTRTISPSRAMSPSRSATPSRASSRAASRTHTPSNSGGGSNLPPPLPPDVLARMQEKHPNAVLTPITVRKGFWNRRGDHLTQSGYIVYAPPNQSNPRELAKYPSPHRAFMDFDGHTVPYDSNMQELPASLPRYGQPPVQPYESFIQYERRWHPVKPLTPP